MSIRFKCLHCDRQIKVRAESAGRGLKCPGCGNKVRVPTPIGGALEPQETRLSKKPLSDQAETPKPEPRKAPRSQPPKRRDRSKPPPRSQIGDKNPDRATDGYQDTKSTLGTLSLLLNTIKWSSGAMLVACIAGLLGTAFYLPSMPPPSLLAWTGWTLRIAGIICGIAQVVALIFLCIWTRQTNINARVLGHSKLGFPPLLAGLLWFLVPLNIILPWIAINFLWRTHSGYGKSSALILLPIIAEIVGGFTAYIAIVDLGAVNVLNVDMLLSTYLLVAVSMLCEVLSAWATNVIVHNIWDWQEQERRAFVS